MSWVAVGMAGVGLLKGATVDKQKEKKQALLQSETTRYSPWTHMQGAAPERADPIGNGLAGFGAGLAMDQNNQAFKLDKALKEKALNNPYTTNVNTTGGWGNSGGSNVWGSMSSMDDYKAAPNPYSQFRLF